MPTLDVARDDMLGLFTVKWDANTPAVNGGAIPRIYYDGRGEPGSKPHDAAWCRHQIRHTLGEVTAIGGRRTTKIGLVTIQIFTPFENGKGLTLGEELAKIGKAAYETVVSANDVIFRNVRALEVGEDGPWYQWNVLAEFEYDEFV